MRWAILVVLLVPLPVLAQDGKGPKQPPRGQGQKEPLRVLVIDRASLFPEPGILLGALNQFTARQRGELYRYTPKWRREEEPPDTRKHGRFILRRIIDPTKDPTDVQANLARFKLIILVDPDWEALEPGVPRLLLSWVKDHGGGLVFLAGEKCLHLSKAKGEERKRLQPVFDLLPIVPGDGKLPVLTFDSPRRLNFTEAARRMPFLRLDPKKPDKPLSGWEEFFYGEAKGRKRDLRAGFHSVWAVDAVKKGSAVLATFDDPKARMPKGGELPYLVTSACGKGRVVYIGSAETFELIRDERGATFHERFWHELARYAARGSTKP